MIAVRISVASVLLGAVSYFVWLGLDKLLGHSLIGQIVSVGAGISAGIYVYVRLVLTMRVTEAHQIRNLLFGRQRRARSA